MSYYDIVNFHKKKSAPAVKQEADLSRLNWILRGYSPLRKTRSKVVPARKRERQCAGRVRLDTITLRRYGRCGTAASTGHLRPILPGARSTGRCGTRVPGAASSRGRGRLQSRGR